jgi:hypothetical protein
MGDRGRESTQPDHHLDAEPQTERDDLIGPFVPAKIGFGAGEDEQAPAVGFGRVEQAQFGPGQAAVGPVRDPQQWPPGALVEQGVGVEGRQHGVRDGLEQGVDSRRPGIACIDPAVEPEHEYGAIELGPALDGRECHRAPIGNVMLIWDAIPRVP